MATKEARLRANARYKSKTVKKVLLEFFPNDADLLDFLETKKPKATYIKNLIRKDMEDHK